MQFFAFDLRKTPLSLRDKRLLRRYRANPNAILTVAVAKVCARSRQTEELIAFLEQELKRYPNQLGIRVYLLDCLFRQGCFSRCQALLQGPSQGLEKNFMAQKIHFILAVLAEDRVRMKALYEGWRRYFAPDELVERVYRAGVSDGTVAARTEVLNYLSAQGIESPDSSQPTRFEPPPDMRTTLYKRLLQVL